MSSKYRRGFAITRDSLRVFTREPTLLVLPALSLLAVGSAFAVLAGIAFQQGLVGSLLTNDLYKYAAMFCAIAISSSVATFFNAAVVHCAAQLFDGNSTSVRDGLAAAWRARRQIAVWAVVAATLGTALYVLDETFGVVGSLTRAVFNLAWALLAFFIVPVIVLDRRRSLRRQLRRSGSLFRETWGESVSATLGVSFVFLLVALPGVALGAVGYFILDGLAATGALVGGGGVVVAAIVGSQTTSAIVRTALYRYATSGERVGPFEGRDPETIFPES